MITVEETLKDIVKETVKEIEGYPVVYFDTLIKALIKNKNLSVETIKKWVELVEKQD